MYFLCMIVYVDYINKQFYPTCGLCHHKFVNFEGGKCKTKNGLAEKQCFKNRKNCTYLWYLLQILYCLKHLYEITVEYHYELYAINIYIYKLSKYLL